MRSLLFVPADSERKLSRAAETGADALILDLEDAVAPGRKAAARAMARAYLSAGGAAGPALYVRINGFDTGLALDDLVGILPGWPAGIVLPKCADSAMVRELDHLLTALEARDGLPRGRTRILPLAVESGAALFTLGGYAGCSARLEALTWGGEDLMGDIGATAKHRAEGGYDDVFQTTRALVLAAAAAAGVSAIDTVYPDFRDHGGLRDDCRAGRRAGFGGKLAIHPGQVPIINEAYAVTAAEAEWARRVVANLEGLMIDKAHLKQARRLLARARDQGGEG